MITKEARNKIRKHSETYLRKVNEKIKKKCKFKINDLVMVRSLRVGNRSKDQCQKLELPFEGPFVINERNENTYTLHYPISNRYRGKFHLDMIYAYDSDVAEASYSI